MRPHGGPVFKADSTGIKQFVPRPGYEAAQTDFQADIITFSEIVVPTNMKSAVKIEGYGAAGGARIEAAGLSSIQQVRRKRERVVQHFF